MNFGEKLRNLRHYYNIISQRKDLQNLIKETENLSPESVNRIINIIEIINEEVERRCKSESKSS
ncbi:MAG: hypothetical protein PWR06_2014 [Thermoanaerobacteraceae bacterium]|nr:hypothetical protein [Thermoanaerobacteraceae bacterium]